MKEIERKFLVCGEFRSQATSSERICQGYLNSSKERTVRVRTKGDKAYITVKGPSAPGSVSRFEWEKEIPVDEALELLNLAESGVIDKTRYLVPNTDGVHTWEIDEFHGANEGLVVAEIELSGEDESFDKPAFVGEEVSSDSRYFNSALSTNPYSNWK